MHITIVNGTTRKSSNSIQVTSLLNKQLEQSTNTCSIVTLENFKTIFTGEYINLENSTLEQKTDIENIINAKIVIFVIPTYHHGMPGSLKNFFDIIDYKSTNLYNKKVIGLVANNLEVDAIRQSRTVLDGIISYYNFTSIIPPKDCKIDPYNIDEKRLTEYVNYITTFATTFNP